MEIITKNDIKYVTDIKDNRTFYMNEADVTERISKLTEKLTYLQTLLSKLQEVKK